MSDAYLMANVQPRESGLPFVAYISERQNVENAQLDPKVAALLSRVRSHPWLRNDVRVWFSRNPPNWTASLSVGLSIEVVEGDMSDADFALACRWIERNRETIIGYWDGTIHSTLDALAALRPL